MVPSNRKTGLILSCRNRIIAGFARPEHPLVIFLDDLQWSDIPTLNLLRNVLLQPNVQHLLFIGSYRDNEIDETHPLTSMLRELEKSDYVPGYIALKSLGEVYVGELIQETLSLPETDCRELTETVMSKTNGNPFFVSEFLKSLYQDNLINYDSQKGNWSWELDKIQKAEITENVVELMARKIRNLSNETQNILKLGSCIGNKFDLRVLSIVSDLSPSECVIQLDEALKAGLILPIGDSYKFLDMQDDNEQQEIIVFKFLHDRVQQAAYNLIDESARKKTHLCHWKTFIRADF